MLERNEDNIGVQPHYSEFPNSRISGKGIFKQKNPSVEIKYEHPDLIDIELNDVYNSSEDNEYLEVRKSLIL